MNSYGKHWCFTLNNYTEQDVARLSSLIEQPHVSYLIFGKEVGESGTPHLQGFISLAQRKRGNAVKTTIGSNPHVEIARSIHNAIEYCKKEGDWIDFGQMGSTQGKRSDLEAFKEDVKAGTLDHKELRETHSDVWAKYTRFCIAYVQDNQPTPEPIEHELRPWQQALLSILESEPDSRKINFIVDEVGNSGKSWFAHWYAYHHKNDSQVLNPGPKKDMAYALAPGLRVFFLDAPRSKQGEFIQYDFLEDLKNGYVFSTKYESRIKTYKPMHVVVSMNERPDMTKLSADRYNIINIRQL